MRRAAILVLLLVACAGGDKPPASEPAPAPAPTADDKLRAAQVSAVHAMCERLVQCSIEDARATMSPDELAKLAPEELVPRAEADCEAEYGASALSPRQIKVIQRCVNEAAECAALDTCLAETKQRD
jgi:hypothetical protein